MEIFLSANTFAHVAFGSLCLAGGALALTVVKGSKRHILGGKVFAWTTIAVVLTSLLSMFHEFLPLAIVLALAMAYMVSSALLSFNRDFSYFRTLNVLLMSLSGLLCAFTLLQFVRVNFVLGQFFIGPLALALMFGFVFAQDWHMLRVRPTQANYWIRRHLVRMILAFTIAVMALVRIGINFGLSLEASVVIPLAIAVPFIAWSYRRYPVLPAPPLQETG